MRIVVTGANGRLGAALVRNWQKRFDLRPLRHIDLDLGDFDAVRARLGEERFDCLVNCAAQTNVDRCETEKSEAFRLNSEAAGVLAETASRHQARMIHLSTDYVFNGEKRQPYTEEDAANPISIYGQSKFEGENAVLAASDRHLVIRVSWVFGPDRPSFIDAMIKRAMESEKVEAIADKFSAPTYTHDIAEMLPQFFENDAPAGLLHFSNAGECSWQQYAQHALDCCRQAGVRLRTSAVEPLHLAEMTDFLARRPVYTVLSAAKYAKVAGTSPRPWREAVADYIMRSYSKT